MKKYSEFWRPAAAAAAAAAFASVGAIVNGKYGVAAVTLGVGTLLVALAIVLRASG